MYLRATLPNGMRIICEAMPHVNSVSIGLWIAAGSRDEERDRAGVSHLIEHMLFKGTTCRSAREIAEAIDAVGGQLNAFTTREYTCIYARLLDRHLELGLDLLADMYCHSILDTEEIAKEKSVIGEEIKCYEDTPDEAVHDLLAAALWPGHPLGRPILGTSSSTAQLTRKDIQDHLAIFFHPANTVLSAAGHVDFDKIVMSAQHHFDGIPSNKDKPARAIPIPAAGRLAKNKDTEQVHLCLGAMGVSRSSTDKYAVHVLDSILGGSMSSRLFQRLREERGLVYATGTSHLAFCDTGMFSIYAATTPDQTYEVMRLIRAELSRLVEEPIPSRELSRAKEHLRGSFLLSLEGTSGRMSRIAKAELYYDTVMTPEEIGARVEAVTAEDVTRMARHILAERPLAGATVAPHRVKLELDELFGRSALC